MKLILLGASGMVGAGALRVALEAPDVDAVLSIGRRPCGVTHPKLRELPLESVRLRDALLRARLPTPALIDRSASL